MLRDSAAWKLPFWLPEPGSMQKNVAGPSCGKPNFVPYISTRLEASISFWSHHYDLVIGWWDHYNEYNEVQ